MLKFKPVKHLGQNFLLSRKIAEKITAAAELNPNDIVLEIGPGKGILTTALLEKLTKGKLIAVEKDKKLAEVLKENLYSNKNLLIICDDILKFKPLDFKLCSLGYKIVANIPYYLTSKLLRKFLQSDCQPSKIVIMVQKEVAKRIIAEDGRESILSLSVKCYGQPAIIRVVLARYFFPQPKVDSAILLIDNISKKFFEDVAVKKKNSVETKDFKKSRVKGMAEKREEVFFKLIKKGFSDKRKFLKNNLKYKSEIFKNCGISEKARAENLSLTNWECLLKSNSELN